MIKIVSIRDPAKAAARLRPRYSEKDKSAVKRIIDDIKRKGDSALRRYEKRFGGVWHDSFLVSKREIQEAYSEVSDGQLRAIREAKKRLEKSERFLFRTLKKVSVDVDGTKITRSFVPISSVACYVPGGLARYPSSAIMSVVPAKIAGVKRVVVLSPPGKDGRIDATTLVAAKECGADEILKIGGAHGIAGVAYGTESIKPVDKIVGPGGFYVTMAKSIVSYDVSIDMIAGPTELCVISDAKTDSKLVSSDLISQAEHSKDTFCYVITTSKKEAYNIRDSLKESIKKAKRREIVESSINHNGFIAVCDTQKKAVELANILAPEHLQIMTDNAQKLSSQITTAGLTLVGSDTPSSVSDYLLGSNHILPTNSFGRSRGGLCVLDFVKLDTKIKTTKKALRDISKHMEVFSDTEGLQNHFQSLKERTR